MLLADATAEAAKQQGQNERDRRAAASRREEVRRREVARALRQPVLARSAVGAVVSFVGLIAHVWVAPRFPPKPSDWVGDTAHQLLHWPSALAQEVTLGIAGTVLAALALAALLSSSHLVVLDRITTCACAVGVVCVLPMVLILATIIVVGVGAVLITVAVVGLIGWAIAAGMSG